MCSGKKQKLPAGLKLELTTGLRFTRAIVCDIENGHSLNPDDMRKMLMMIESCFEDALLSVAIPVPSYSDMFGDWKEKVSPQAGGTQPPPPGRNRKPRAGRIARAGA